MTGDYRTKIDNVCKAIVKTTKYFQMQYIIFRKYFNVFYTVYNFEKRKKDGQMKGDTFF